MAHFGNNLEETEEVEVILRLRLVSNSQEDLTILFGDTTASCDTVHLLTNEVFVKSLAIGISESSLDGLCVFPVIAIGFVSSFSRPTDKLVHCIHQETGNNIFGVCLVELHGSIKLFLFDLLYLFVLLVTEGRFDFLEITQLLGVLVVLFLENAHLHLSVFILVIVLGMFLFDLFDHISESFSLSLNSSDQLVKGTKFSFNFLKL